ncbi:MAG: S-layer homology domain-containing protein [Candidatus Margulisbacteria bacterium]|nr:S-layer homology domain-containing protein [Candidatus Margulisiibacteriota bacterium]
MNKLALFIILTLVLGFTCSDLAQAASDPMRLATGARPLGMGKAFVGLADDVGSVFLNPAGLANLDCWQATSMSGKFLDDFNYLSFSGVYPTTAGNLGIAYVNSTIGGALPTTIEASSDPDDPIYIVDISQDQMSYSNGLLILSYADKLARLLDLPLLSAIGNRFPGLKGVNFGANFKLFNVSLTGDRISNSEGSATGTELDIGLQGKPLPWLSLGSNIQNALPFSLGGKLRYDSGWEESFPAVAKLGLAANILGPENALRRLGNHKVDFLADVDYEISRANLVPALWHLGLEWQPIALIAIRAGIDQEMSGPTEVVNNFTSGAGVNYGNFRFDYAYHTFADAPGINNHFFSLSYGIAPVKKIKDRLVASPDKLITTDTIVTVKGTAVDPQITQVKANGLKVDMDPRGEFRTRASLKVGKNTVRVEGFDQKDKLVDWDNLRVLRLITYPDVAKDYWASEQISYIGTLGIIKGYPDGKFKPNGSITRAELAALLIRTKMGGDANVPPAKEQVFADVPLSHWAAKYINLAAELGIVKGYPDKTFKPSGDVTRAEGLAMIARFGGVKQILYTDIFIDVKGTHWAATIISGAYQEGMLIHFKDKPFGPSRKLTRAESVEMLYRSQPVTILITDLLDFEKGY